MQLALMLLQKLSTINYSVDIRSKVFVMHRIGYRGRCRQNTPSSLLTFVIRKLTNLRNYRVVRVPAPCACRAFIMSSKRKAASNAARASKLARVPVSAPPVIQSLSPEIMCMILAHIPFRPRLHVLSLVCKQWRTLVLRSVRSTPALQYPARVLSLFPSLEELVIDSEELLLKVPRGLQSLVIRRAQFPPPGGNDVFCYAAVVLKDPRNLTPLCVDEHRDCRALVPLLKSCQSTLREVYIWHAYAMSSIAAQAFLCGLLFGERRVFSHRLPS